jgi:chromosome segregation protein
MHLRSLTIKGFKSFPDRTRLEFAPGVSVIVGPNGSGKSNITDAVLWALGEQSPLAVRGQSMQDVIFAGGPGLPSRSAAEVEVVLDNSDGGLASDFSEVSILRRLDRGGEGEYRLNGARCRLVDVLEALSDTGLGREMHSVVSQGRIEAIVHSRAGDRRLLIEEAAGLGKHRKRRHRSELKLRRVEQNLDRARDVEREARSHLRPLKRQAEAAEQHVRLERGQLEARLELALEDARTAAVRLGEADRRAGDARAGRDAAERRIAAVAAARREAEEAFAARAAERERRSGGAHAARSASERVTMRRERVEELARASARAARRRREELAELERTKSEAGAEAPSPERVEALQAELERLDAERARQADAELEQLTGARAEAQAGLAALRATTATRRAALDEAEAEAEDRRAAHRRAEQELTAARRVASEVGAELARVLRVLRASIASPAEGRALAESVRPHPGYERALAAALGPLLEATVVGTVEEGEALLEAAGDQGAAALVVGGGEAPASEPSPPAAGAQRLLDHVALTGEDAAAVERLLASVWVVASLAEVDPGFRGVAVTSAGDLWRPLTGELRRRPSGGQRPLEHLARRDELIAASERAAGAERSAEAAVAEALAAVEAAEAARAEAEASLRAAGRDEDLAAEELRRLERQLVARRETPEDGPSAVRRAELAAELRAERRLLERALGERRERARRAARLRARAAHEESIGERAGHAGRALSAAAAAVVAHRDRLEAALAAGSAAAEETAARLRECAAEEAEAQRALSAAAALVTTAEVELERAGDRRREADAELETVWEALGHAGSPEPAEPEPLRDERRAELEATIARLGRRREALGPVNPLAGHEYEEALSHVEELERQREDLEAALSELSELIAELDRHIRRRFDETFAAAARNFEEVVEQLFPGGRGRLRLVGPEGPHPVTDDDAGSAADDHESPGEPAAGGADSEAPAAEEPGVEVEVTPGGKSMRRLSLLSGGEKSLVALAFLFAVFLARPCPFYLLDEVEAALDDLNIGRFLDLLRRFSDRAQFIVVTHQKRTMDAADSLYGVSMGADGVSRVVSRRLPGRAPAAAA